MQQGYTGLDAGAYNMPVGSTWEIYIPYELGYGIRGAGEKIPPFSTLIFKVELLSIEK